MTGEEIEDIKKRIERLEEAVFKAGVRMETKQKSPREFINSIKARGDVEKTLLICYFLEIMRGVRPFSKLEIEEAFREAKIPPPGKLSDKIYQNARKAFLMEMDKNAIPKTYELTQTGIEHVENDLFNEEK